VHILTNTSIYELFKGFHQITKLIVQEPMDLPLLLCKRNQRAAH